MLKMILTADEMRHYEEMLNELTKEGIEVQFGAIGYRTTICLLRFPNGWEILGKAHALNHRNFDYTVGRYWALKDAYKNAKSYMENSKSSRNKSKVEKPSDRISNLMQRLDDSLGGDQNG